MANISTDDVRTYIVDLIEKELGFCDQGDISAARGRKTDKRQAKNPPSRPELHSSIEDTCDE